MRTAFTCAVVLRSLPARVRLPVSAVTAADLARLERRLRRTPGVRSAGTDRATGSLLVHFDAGVLPLAGLLRLAAGAPRAGSLLEP